MKIDPQVTSDILEKIMSFVTHKPGNEAITAIANAFIYAMASGEGVHPIKLHKIAQEELEEMSDDYFRQVLFLIKKAKRKHPEICLKPTAKKCALQEEIESICNENYEDDEDEEDENDDIRKEAIADIESLLKKLQNLK